MSLGPFDYDLAARPAQIGLIVLQADETIELDFRRLVAPEAELLVSRVPSGEQLTAETIAGMEGHLTAAAALFPRGSDFAAVGYACTSGTAQIGAKRVAELVAAGTGTQAVTEPVSALVAACRALGIRRLGLLSPYVAEVSDRLRRVLEVQGVATPAFGSFELSEEARVARIDGPSVMAAAEAVAAGAEVDGLFLSCTNLRTLSVIPALEGRLGMPVLSSNQVLAWRLLALAGLEAPAGAPGRLFSGR